jgi:hypothetical protein
VSRPLFFALAIDRVEQRFIEELELADRSASSPMASEKPRTGTTA